MNHIDDTDVRIYDATFHMPNSGRSAEKEFPEKHLPHARFFDVDAVSDPIAISPHMLPSAEHFARTMEQLGLGDEQFAIAYDVHGLMSAARLWWMLRVFGHDRVAVLDGGLPAWEAAGGDIATGPAENSPAKTGSFTPRFRAELVRSLDEMRANVTTGDSLVLDARGGARFRGDVAEPRAGVRSGHIPGSRSLPYTELLDETGKFKSESDLVAHFDRIGVTKDTPVIASCGSGITACVLALGLACLGRENVAIYDGSWSEWGAHETCPIETGSV